MDDFNLYRRLREFGTLTEIPSDVPDPTFALPSTVNWMRALAILVGALPCDFKTAHGQYARVQKRSSNDKEVNTVCEQLLFTLNQLAALRAMDSAPNKADVARMAIITWYYGIYASASAMVAAADGSFQDNHASTAQHWDRQFAATRLAMEPFSGIVSKLDQATVDREIEIERRRGRHPLIKQPENAEQAWGCVTEYLSGTVAWEQWNIRARLIENRDFKALMVSDFRTAAARKLRDSWYERRSISFVHQASRYRGKANYRDSVYLAYGRSVPTQVDGLVNDLAKVLTGFSSMAAAYVSARLGSDLWQHYLDDIESKRSVSISPKSVWC